VATQKLNAVQRNLDSLAQRENDIAVRLADLEDEIAKTEQKITKSQNDLGAARARLEERLVALYKQGSSAGLSYADVLLSATDLASVLERFDDLSQIADEDQKLFDEVEGYLLEQQESRRLLQEKQAKQAADLAELSRTQEEAARGFAAANQTYSALKSQVNKLKADIQKADASAAAAAATARRRALQRMTSSTSRTWNNSSNGTIQPPPFTFPVRGAHSYIDTWGAPRPGGRTHKGTDIFAARNTPLVACASGTIVSVFPYSVGIAGVSVSIRGNNGYGYFYCHLDHVESGIHSGMSVTAGQVIGYCGNTGNARREACHLHFQIEPGGGAPVNPYPTLRYYDR
jgi:murein DD-endopeptidase MepM/ murein hydrolase activator NlpD